MAERLRFATGLTDLIKNNSNYIINWRIIIRYTFFQKLHFEFAAADKGIDTDNTPKSIGIGFYIRNNF